MHPFWHLVREPDAVFFLSCDTWGLPWLVAEWSGLPVIFVFFCTSTTHKMAWMKLSGHDNDSHPASLHCLHGSGAKLVLKVWLHHHDDSQPRLPLQCHHLRTAMDRKQSTCWNRHAGPGNQFCTTFTQKAQCWHNIFHTQLKGNKVLKIPIPKPTNRKKIQVLFILNLSIAVTDMLPVLMLVAFTLVGGDLDSDQVEDFEDAFWNNGVGNGGP